MSNYNVVRPPGTDPMATISTSIKYLTQPHDGQPGTLWDDFEERLLNVLAGQSCENGWSLAVRSPTTSGKSTRARPVDRRCQARLVITTSVPSCRSSAPNALSRARMTLARRDAAAQRREQSSLGIDTRRPTIRFSMIRGCSSNKYQDSLDACAWPDCNGYPFVSVRISFFSKQ